MKRLGRKEKNRIKQIYLKPLDSLWYNLVNMDNNDFNLLKLYISEMNSKNCSFVHFYSKDLLNTLIELSEVYHKK